MSIIQEGCIIVDPCHIHCVSVESELCLLDTAAKRAMTSCAARGSRSSCEGDPLSGLAPLPPRLRSRRGLIQRFTLSHPCFEWSRRSAGGLPTLPRNDLQMRTDSASGTFLSTIKHVNSKEILEVKTSQKLRT